jgi:hypothetical protein
LQKDLAAGKTVVVVGENIKPSTIKGTGKEIGVDNYGGRFPYHPFKGFIGQLEEKLKEAGIEWAQRKLEQIRKEKMSKQMFQTDDEKRIVVGAAMVPDLKIFRKDKQGNPYHVYFSAETIKMIAEKYMRNKYIDNNDTEHNGKAANDVYVVESWIKEDEEDKSNKYGFADLPIGTWFVSMKVRNDEVWRRIKSKELNGFSVSGYFEEIEQFYKEQEFLREVAKILKDL